MTTENDLRRYREVIDKEMTALSGVSETSKGTSSTGWYLNTTPGTAPSTGGTGFWRQEYPDYQPRSISPSWEELMASIIRAAVADAIKEMTETLKDLQEQIDDLWEAMKDE